MSDPKHHRPRGSLRSIALLAALVGALVVPSAAFATTTTTAEGTCDGHWPAATHGKPVTFVSGARAGDYLWHNARGWHLRVTKASSTRAVFTGRIRSDKPITVTGVLLEKGDTFTLSADKLILTYRFVNHGRVDGLDFTTACAERLVIGGSMNGVKLPIGRIWVGARGHHPLQNPFVIRRVH